MGTKELKERVQIYFGHNISVYLPQGLVSDIEDFCEATGRSVNGYLKKLLWEELGDDDDLETVKIILKNLELNTHKKSKSAYLRACIKYQLKQDKEFQRFIGHTLPILEMDTSADHADKS